METILDQLNTALNFFIKLRFDDKLPRIDEANEKEKELIALLNKCKNNSIRVYEDKEYQTKMDTFFRSPENKGLFEAMRGIKETKEAFAKAWKYEKATEERKKELERYKQLQDRAMLHFYNSTNHFVKEGENKIIFLPVGIYLDNVIRSNLK